MHLPPDFLLIHRLNTALTRMKKERGNGKWEERRECIHPNLIPLPNLPLRTGRERNMEIRVRHRVFVAHGPELDLFALSHGFAFVEPEIGTCLLISSSVLLPLSQLQ